MAVGESKIDTVVRIVTAPSSANIILVCEHAANHIPDAFGSLGLSTDLTKSHIAWDPGAIAVAERLATLLSAPLVAGCVSRLLYDCNRPPESAGAILEKSERHVIPGNLGLSDAERQARVSLIYDPFKKALTDEIARRRDVLELLVTIHSFTPVYHSQKRAVEIGILHGRDPKFAEAMICARPIASDFDVRLNEPYGPSDGVAHTLDLHGVENGLLNVMIEIRNDLIATEPAQHGMAHILADWIRETLAQLGKGDAA